MYRRIVPAAIAGTFVIHALCGTAAAQEPPPDPAVVFVAAEAEADLVRIVADLANLGETSMFDAATVILFVDGAEVLVDDTVGPLDVGETEAREWTLGVEDAWRGRPVAIRVRIDTGDLPDFDQDNNEGFTRVEVPAVAFIPPDDDGFPWLWPVVAVPPVVVVVGGAQALKVRRRRIRQANSEPSQPPDDCRSGETHTQRECEPDPARRKFTSVELRDGWRSTGEPVKLLNAALKEQRRGREEKLQGRIAAAARLLADGLRTMPDDDGGSRDVAVVGHVEGGSVKCTFTYRICLGAGWEVEKSWTARIKDRADVAGGVLRGVSMPPPESIEGDLAALVRRMVEQAPLVPPLTTR